ncbi:Anionic antimicrobial peptide 2 [Eumeta japonica]|uniref:Anionic antimicrobial peptide 2 n=1 Tax=Eumeta variegata TaxID=151549 RepID=A0A4C1TJQ7_EUMVA|nr:Anionic antimicrobial peptide 2 [Eumeta japonica]
MVSKSILVLLVVCLAANALAFVKRDANQPNYLEQLQKQLEEMGKNINEKLSTVFDPEQMKQNFNKGIEDLQKTALAFVKRDAPATQPNYLEQLQKQLEEFGKNINEKVSTVFDPEQMKQNFNKGIEDLQKAINNLQPKSDPPKEKSTA